MSNFLRFGHSQRASVRETWILDGPTWKLPVCVKTPKPGQSEVELRLGAGLHLLDIQRQAAGAFLDAIGQKKGTRWIINREMLSTVARRTVRAPEECVIWNPCQERPELYGTLRFGRQSADLFCQSFFESNYCQRLQDITEVVYLFNAFCKHAFNWLLNLQRPLDLVFCVLHPVPYRIDWRTRVTKGNLLDPKLLDYDPDKEVIRWGLEVHPTELWDAHVAKLEAQRKLEKGDGYWASALDMIKRCSAHLIKLYAHFKDKAAHPSAPLPPEWVEERGDPVPGREMPVASAQGNGVPVQPLHRKTRKGRRKPVAKAD